MTVITEERYNGGIMSMSIKDLHSKIYLAPYYFGLSHARGLITSKARSLAPSPYIESLIKHPYLPRFFGEAYDKIMAPQYCLEEAKTNIKFSEFGRSHPETAILSERAMMQTAAIQSLLEDAKKWIESNDISFTHHGNIEAFDKNIDEYFEKGESFEEGWDRIVLALQTFIAERLLPVYPVHAPLKTYCHAVVSLLDAENPPSEEQEKQRLKKRMSDLKWYFFNYCVGSTQIEDVPQPDEEPLNSLPVSLATTPSQISEDAVAVCDGRLMALPDGTVYVNRAKTDDVQRCVGITLYALLKKKYGCVSTWDIARAIHGEQVPKPSKKREAAIRRYVSTLRKLLKHDFSDSRILNDRGIGYTFEEQTKSRAAVA